MSTSSTQGEFPGNHKHGKAVIAFCFIQIPQLLLRQCIINLSHLCSHGILSWNSFTRSLLRVSILRPKLTDKTKAVTTEPILINLFFWAPTFLSCTGWQSQSLGCQNTFCLCLCLPQPPSLQRAYLQSLFHPPISYFLCLAGRSLFTVTANSIQKESKGRYLL